MVRVKILWLYCDIGLECPGANLNNLVDETMHLIKNETSHKVTHQYKLMYLYKQTLNLSIFFYKM